MFTSKEEADEYLANSENLNPELSGGEDEALEWYKGEGFYDINEDYRAAGYSPDDRADLIESALARGKTDRDLVVWRGVDYETFEDYDDLTGDTFTDDAFVSTSLVKSIAENHSDGVLVEIRVPEGTSALNMERWKVSNWPAGEAELMLKNGTKFRVISDDGIDADLRNMVVEIVP